MAKFKLLKIIKSNKGQSVVEYIMLLAVISSIVFFVFRNPKFKAFFQSDAGMFSLMRKGMAYSYRYGREYQDSNEYDAATSFEYTSPDHHLYLNKKDSNSRFFMGSEKYGE